MGRLPTHSAQDGDRVRLCARTGTDYTTYARKELKLPGAALPIGAAVIAGEAVAFDAEGALSFTALRWREGRGRRSDRGL
jgi:ATP-dependent DNA ligase